ncbi:MAG: C4-type zinc ribbon domain-containing protein [Propioniciclava sp.]|uniref:zinc ribbon domain-containing protein n=1 Tax=Propioniciclava sp. TaxID=2038686 RepID=UPI0039E6E8E0
MKAAAEAQQRLLALQAVDTAIAQLDHRKNTLDETAQARALQAQRAHAAERVIEVETRVFDLEADLAKAEADLVPVRERRERNQKRVQDGSVGDPKALQGLLAEIDHLGRRISELEDAELDAMQELEDARELAAEAVAAKGVIEDEMRAVLKVREEKLTEIAADRGRREAERDAIAAALPPELLSLYTRIAQKAGGVGAALLRGGRCGGCQLEANSADLTRYREAASDEVLRCEECNRILVRTEESGL